MPEVCGGAAFGTVAVACMCCLSPVRGFFFSVVFAGALPPLAWNWLFIIVVRMASVISMEGAVEDSLLGDQETGDLSTGSFSRNCRTRIVHHDEFDAVLFRRTACTHRVHDVGRARPEQVALLDIDDRLIGPALAAAIALSCMS